MIEKSITLNHTGFYIGGEVSAVLHNGEEITHKIKIVHIPDPNFEITEESILKYINTGCIEVRHINYVVAEVFIDYEGYKKFYEQFNITF